MDERFICSINDSSAVTYRAMLYFSRQCSVAKLSGCIENWVRSGPKINRLVVNPDCNLTINTFNDSLCSMYTIQSPRSLFRVFLIGWLAGGIFVLLCLASLLLCILLVEKKKRESISY